MNQRTVVLVGMVAFLSCCAGCRNKAETTPEKQKPPREPARDTMAQKVVGEPRPSEGLGEHHVLSYGLRRKASPSGLTENQPPKGFVALFNGKDLAGWKGLVGNPITRAGMSPQDLAKAQVKADEQMRAHWKVVDGASLFLTARDTASAQRRTTAISSCWLTGR